MALALLLTHPLVAGLLLAAVLSAILSTVSSQLLVVASAVSYDLVEKMLGRAADDRRSLVLGRWSVAVVGLLGILVALTEVRLVFWFVLFAWSALGASFGPLVLLAVAGPKAVTRHGALAGMLTGAGVTVAWKLGRDIPANPEAFALVPLATLALGALILLIGRATRRFAPSDLAAVLTAVGLTLGSWWLVQQWDLRHLYELVPAFALATLAALAVSRLPAAGAEVEPRRH